uniref:Uncharacterized protein n=1 Tax=Vitis vinifera TaxID=29760 RepID=F6HPB5_VITVI
MDFSRIVVHTVDKIKICKVESIRTWRTPELIVHTVGIV